LTPSIRAFSVAGGTREERLKKVRRASAEIRARLGHPVIDGDGHIVEYGPTDKDYRSRSPDRASSSASRR
jgi:hypothetical protein